MLIFNEKVVNSSRNTYILSLAVYIVSYEQGLLFGNDCLGIQAMTHPEKKTQKLKLSGGNCLVQKFYP